jgi:hypothetical protein
MVRTLALAFASLGLIGCAAHAPAARHASTPSAPSSSKAEINDASGVWDWMFSSRDDQGDERLEQEEWHLVQRSGKIEGYYDRKVTMLSVDERLFRCNQRLGFTKVTRVRVSGTVAQGHINLREIAFEAKPGPCDDGARQLVEYSGVLDGTGQMLQLRWAPGAGQMLRRRLDNQPPLLQAVDFQPDSREPSYRNASTSPGVSMPVDGTWEWELRSIDADGDERYEREEWHLSESEEGVQGYYDRTVRRVRAEGTFEQTLPSCKQTQYETKTRYTVRGQRFGEKLMLREVDYQADRTSCDNAFRRLDNYSGSIADADSLVLSWGQGNQLLRRKNAR